MTGFGNSAITTADATNTVEVKSLNSKFLDLTIRLPKKFSDKENEVRLLIADSLERGKISVLIESQKKNMNETILRFDETLFTANYSTLKKMADQVMAGYDRLFELALEAPGVKKSEAEEAEDPAEWETIVSNLKQAIALCNQFREAEGKVLGEKLQGYIEKIEQGLQQITLLEPARTQRIRTKLKENIEALKVEADSNRLEQEIIFYIEKLDIQEECVRLTTHLNYFLSILKEKGSNGKKLGFIAQEIGREINTIGSKANDAGIQKYVVEMKDELEKIKEQLNNVL